MSIQPDDMKATMRLWASGVTVVTTSNGTQRHGTTASSFTSVSLTPPLILICLYKDASIMEPIQQNGHFAVSILGEKDSHVSSQLAGFAAVPEGEDRFYNLDFFTKETGSPIYSHSLGWMDCKLHALYEGGTHHIVVGEVIATATQTDSPDPLLYFNRNYRTLAPLP